jgi:hypothetical protein
LRRQAPREVDPALWTGKRRSNATARESSNRNANRIGGPTDVVRGSGIRGPRTGIEGAQPDVPVADGKTAVVEATAVSRGVTQRVTSSRPSPLPWPLL